VAVGKRSIEQGQLQRMGDEGGTEKDPDNRHRCRAGPDGQ